MTGRVSQQSDLVDGIPHNVNDLHPALEVGHSATDESDESGDKLLLYGTSGPPELSDELTVTFSEMKNCGAHSASKECVDQKATPTLHHV